LLIKVLRITYRNNKVPPEAPLQRRLCKANRILS
jgi:hypothetical protein